MKRILYVLSVFALLTSCMKDQSNYDYTEINMITVELESSYSVNQTLSPNITPIISQSMEEGEDNLEYYWVIESDTVCKEKVLDVPIYYSIGTKSLKLFVVDKNTGVYGSDLASLYVTGEYGRGLIILGDYNNEATLTYQSEDYAKDPLVNFLPDVGTNPKFIYYLPGYTSSAQAYIVVACEDENGGSLLDPSDMTVGRTYNENFYLTPSPSIPMACALSNDYRKSYSGYANNKYYQGSYSSDVAATVNNGLLYQRYYNSGETDHRFQTEVPAPDTKGYYFSNVYCGIQGYNMNYGLGYDTKNKRFLCSGGSYYESLLVPGTGTTDPQAFDHQNLGDNAEMLFGDVVYYSSNPEYAYIMNDGTNNYLLNFTIGYWRSNSIDALQKVLLSPSEFPIDENTVFATSSIVKSLIFSKDQTSLKSYDIDSGVITDLFSDFGAGEKITYMKQIPWAVSTTTTYFSNHYLYVTTNSGDEMTDNHLYVIELFANNTAELVQKVSGIAGETVSIAWVK